jgi:hypothetical protein
MEELSTDIHIYISPVVPEDQNGIRWMSLVTDTECCIPSKSVVQFRSYNKRAFTELLPNEQLNFSPFVERTYLSYATKTDKSRTDVGYTARRTTSAHGKRQHILELHMRNLHLSQQLGSKLMLLNVASL